MKKQELDSIVAENELVLLDIWATWCEPCKMLDHVLIDLQQLLPELTIVKADVDESPELQTEYSVKSVPVLMLFHNGMEKWRMNGFMMAPELEHTIKEVISY